jgi:hypothetical protein
MIDINNVNIQKLKMTDLIADAVERKDEEALKWLHEQAMKKVAGKDKDGNATEKFQPVNMFRVEYLTKFCGYQKKEAVKLTAEQKRERMLSAMFDEAFASIK